MKFHVNRDVFSEAVSFVVKLLPQRNPQPILAGVLIEASADGLSLAAFDYEAITGLRIEAKQKFSRIRPASLDQATRISGITPADVALVLAHIQSRKA